MLNYITLASLYESGLKSPIFITVCKRSVAYGVNNYHVLDPKWSNFYKVLPFRQRIRGTLSP